MRSIQAARFTAVTQVVQSQTKPARPDQSEAAGPVKII
jgi:hypothetical protein